VVPLAEIPAQAELVRPQTVSNRAAVWFPVSPELATQEREATMQEQRSALATGGRFLEAAQAVPVAGHAEATVLETT
jgi:hypothetical protein